MAVENKPKFYILLGIPVLILTGTLFHFLYSLTGEMFAVGLIAPVNESVFEHMKLVVVPVFLWWSLLYLFRKDNLRADSWFTSALLAMLTAVAAIPVLYYFYTGAFGFESVIVDIIIFVIAVVLGQFIGLHYYIYGNSIDYRLAFMLMFAVIVLFAVLTVIPPELPLFTEP